MTNQIDVLDQLKAGHEAISSREQSLTLFHVLFMVYVFILLPAEFLRYLGMNEILSYAVGIPFYVAYLVWFIRTYRRERDKRNTEFERAYQAASSTPGAHS